MNEEFPLDPRLRALTQRAARQKDPVVHVTLADIRRVARVRQRRAWVGSVAAFAAAIALAWVGLSRRADDGERVPAHAPSLAQAEKTEERPRLEPGSVAMEPASASAPALQPPTLAEAIAVRALEGSPEPVILAPWTVGLYVAGEYEVRVAASAEHGLEVHTLGGGRVFAPGTQTRLVVTPQGELETPSPAQPAISSPVVPESAARLSKAAEEAMGAGERSTAIRMLRRLVGAFPRSPEARAGLLDLARLEMAMGHDARAACAYRVYLERWPETSVRPEVERALGKLGETPRCRGLQPR